MYDAKAKYNNNINQKLDNKEDSLKINDIYIPKCLVLISLYPYFTILEKINKEIYNYSLKINSDSEREDYYKCRLYKIPIEKIIENLLIELNAPPRGVYKIKFELNYETIFLPQKKMNQLPLIDVDLKNIYNTFDENDIITIYNYILLESKIIFVSKNINYLYQIIYGFVSLLYPFEYYFQIITFLPKEKLKAFESSVSYIIGILDNDFDFENYYYINKKALKDCDMIVDIDNKRIIILNQNNKKPEFPKNQKKDFKKILRDLISHSKQSKDKDNSELFIESFFTFNANVLYNYNEFINFDGYYSKDINIINNFFKIEKYLKKCSSGDKNFYKALIETKMFYNFLQHKMVPKNSFEIIKVFQFDEKINEISKKFKKNKNYLKQTESYEITNTYEIQLPRALTQSEKDFYNNEENKKKLIDNVVIISNDENNNNQIVFNYPIFPKLKEFHLI